MPLPQRVGALSLYILPTTKFFPSATAFIFRDLQFSLGFLRKLLSRCFLNLQLTDLRDRISTGLPLNAQSPLKLGTHLTGALLVRACLEEPALELSFRGSP